MRADMLQSLFFELPRVRRFIKNLADNLRDRQNLILLTKQYIDREEITQRIEDEISHWAHHERIDLTRLSATEPIAFSISKMYEVEWHKNAVPPTVANLVRAQGLPEILFIEGFEYLRPEHRSRLLEFLEQWSQYSHNALDVGGRPTAFVLVIPANSTMKLPKSNVALSVRWLWGIPSGLESKLLIRIMQETNSVNNSWQNLWRENVLPAISGDDLSLADQLWDDCLDISRITDSLRKYAMQREWDRQSLLARGITESFSGGLKKERYDISRPPQQWKGLWEEGLITWTTEYGAEIHIAAIVQLEWKEELQHRLWRGQAQLLLPMIDDLRLYFCERLTRDYGRDWPFKIQEPADEEQKEKVRETPLACEWGHMQYLISTCHFFKSSRQLVPTIKLARQIRNDLAHYQPIEFPVYNQFCREYQSKIKNVL